jgi:hypothetical protein
MLGDQERVIFPNTALANLSIGDFSVKWIKSRTVEDTPGGMRSILDALYKPLRTSPIFPSRNELAQNLILCA